MNAFAVALRAARRAKALTQTQLGSLLWPKSARAGRFAHECAFVSQLETGREYPSADLAARIARALDLPPWHFQEALARDAMDATCSAGEVTQVVVGLRAYAQRCSAEEWAAIRGGGA
jgi:transcriptional regulator with XRE-family HTH domain